jgi:hypothetical protein
MQWVRLGIQHDNGLGKTSRGTRRQERLMSNQAGLDTDHIRELIVAKVGHFGRLFWTRIPHDHRDGRHGVVDLAGGLETKALRAACLNNGVYDRVVFGVQKDTVRLVLQNDGIVVGLEDARCARHLVHNGVAAETLDKSLGLVMGSPIVNGKVGVQEGLETKGRRARVGNLEGIGHFATCDANRVGQETLGTVRLGLLDRPRVIVSHTVSDLREIQRKLGPSRCGIVKGLRQGPLVETLRGRLGHERG